MPGLEDMLARGTAAQGMIQGDMGAASPDAMPDEAPMPEGGGDLEGALAAVDAAISTLPPEKQEEARMHMNAIRELAAGDPAADAVEASGPQPEGEEPKMGMPA